jgi:hypothetical protein
MAENGRQYHFTYEGLRDHGDEPFDVLREYHGLLSDCVARNELVVAHNGWFFDRNMLYGNCRRYIPETGHIEWTPNSIFDTGLTEMASQMGPKGQVWPQDTLTTYYQRVNKRGGPIKWALDTHCVQKYGLIDKHNLDMSGAHANPWDCMVTHYLFEHWRELLETHGQTQA